MRPNDSTDIDPADYEWLVSEEAAGLLVELADATAPVHQAIETLRQTHSAARAHLLVEQTNLRSRARAKFLNAERMFFTRVGLEQATDAWVADYKAKRFANCDSVADLCCGIGGDFLAIGSGRAVTGVDLSPVSLLLAQANAAVCGIADARFLMQSAEATDVSAYAAWHVDPDRRPSGRRTTRVELHSPDATAIGALRDRNPNAAIKLAPAAQLTTTLSPETWQAECELEWISRGGECKQLVAWSGSLATNAGERRATALTIGGAVAGMIVGQPAPLATVAEEIGEALYEPDAAVFAAALDGLLAEQHQLARISTSSGYLTGPAGIESPLLAPFRVETVLPLRAKKIAAHLRDAGVGRLELKSRGVSVDLEQLRRQLKLSGESAATLILTPQGRRTVAIVCRRPNSPA